MTFELEADGVHFWCSSPAVTRKLVEKGARLVDEAQAEDLRRELAPAPHEDGRFDPAPPRGPR